MLLDVGAIRNCLDNGEWITGPETRQLVDDVDRLCAESQRRLNNIKDPSYIGEEWEKHARNNCLEWLLQLVEEAQMLRQDVAR